VHVYHLAKHARDSKSYFTRARSVQSAKRHEEKAGAQTHTHTHTHKQTGSEIDFASLSKRNSLTPLEPTTDEVDSHELLLVLVVILIVHKPNGKLSVLRARGRAQGQHHHIMHIN
jgi:hypothetical protein